MNNLFRPLIVLLFALTTGFPPETQAANPESGSKSLTIKGNRFVTLCIMIRTTPWEVSRDVKLHPRD